MLGHAILTTMLVLAVGCLWLARDVMSPLERKSSARKNRNLHPPRSPVPVVGYLGVRIPPSSRAASLARSQGAEAVSRLEQGQGEPSTSDHPTGVGGQSPSPLGSVRRRVAVRDELGGTLSARLAQLRELEHPIHGEGVEQEGGFVGAVPLGRDVVNQ